MRRTSQWGPFSPSGPAVSVVGVGRPCSLPHCHDWIFSSAVISGDEPKEKLELVSYFGKRPPGVLHCTTKFCDYGKATGAEEYAQQDVSSPQGNPGEGGEGEWVQLSSGAAARGRDISQWLEKRGLLLPVAQSLLLCYPLRDLTSPSVPRTCSRAFSLKQTHGECQAATGSFSGLLNPC